MKCLCKLRIVLLAILTVLLTCPASAAGTLRLQDLDGFWSGSLPIPTGRTGNVVRYVLDEAVLYIDSGSSQPVSVAAQSVDFVYRPVSEWNIEQNELVFTHRDADRPGSARLHMEGNDLVGTYKQYGREREVRFTRMEAPEGEIRSDFSFEGRSGSEWASLLREYGSYTVSTTAPIRFEYDLQNTATSDLYTRYGLDELMRTTEGFRDVDRMKAVLDVVCYHFPHDGAVALPEGGLSPKGAADLCLQQGGIECRGLASILSEMLRLCNIPAKVVTCLPAIEPSEDCHVLVQAYSYDLGRWVLLDPTYHLMLRTQDGTYVDLRRLRDALASGETLIANPDAGYNGLPFSMEYYRAYMAKNTFRFTCPVRNAFDAYGGSQGSVYMLVPQGFDVPYRSSHSEIITTSADDFFTAPPPRLDWDDAAPAQGDHTDSFILGGNLYYNAADIRWVSARFLDRGSFLGEIGRGGIRSGQLKNGDATVLKTGTKVFRCVDEGENIAIVYNEETQSYTPYLRQG